MNAHIKHHKLGFLAISLACCLGTGCQDPDPGHGVSTWLATMDKMAADVNKEWQGSNFVIVPLIHGAQYDIGTAFAQTNLSLPFGQPFEACQIFTNYVKIVPMNDFPVATRSNSFSLAGQSPSALSSLISANAGVTNITFSSLIFTNVTQHLIYQDAVDRVIATNADCHALIAGSTKAIVCGYIWGTMNLISTNYNGQGLSVTAGQYGTYSVQHTGVSGLSLQQTEASPWFAIVCDESLVTPSGIRVQEFVENATSSGRVVFSQPHKAELKQWRGLFR